MQEKIQKLLEERYLLPDEKNWDDLAKRVSDIYSPIYDDIQQKKFLPSTPTLMNANTGGRKKGTLSSCFTMDIDDSIDDIFDALKEGAIVTKSSGGVGYVFSKLRSSKEGIQTLSDRKSSGPIPFMRMFNSMLDGIQQGGVRRGAGMGQFDINHPNILDVIRLKNTKGEMERLNLSVRITDEFYIKLKNNPDFPHVVYDKDGNSSPLEDNGNIVTVGKLWDEIVEYAWRCAEPGIFNVDIATRQCTVTNLNPYVLSNPCAEFTNIPYASCNLGSINLNYCVKDGEFDWVEFERLTRNATHYLNNVIDVNDFPIAKIKDVTLKVRPIGLGAMGYAHMLYRLCIPFNSPEANELCNKIFEKLTMFSMDESCMIAMETGQVYPAFDYDLFMKANERFFKDGKYKQLASEIKAHGIANSCFTSIAPNGSIGYIADMTTGGIEPVFALTYARRIEKLDKQYEVVYITDPIFEEYLNNNFDAKTKEKILAQVADNKGSCQKVQEIPENMRKVFVVASDLTPMEHLESLATVAKNTSLSVSKTINLPSNATKEEISDVYLRAHELGVIGVTVYRDGCREGVLVHKVDENNQDVIIKTNAPKRPKSLPCHVYRVNILNKINNQSEKWIIFVGLLNDEPYEIIAGKINGHDFDPSITEGEMIKTKLNGKKVYQFVKDGNVLCEDVMSVYMNELREYSTRLMSLALRHGASVEHLQTVLRKSGTIVDFNQAIVRAISKYVKEVSNKERCPVCNSEMRYVEGCVKCSSPDCSFSKCG